MRHICYIFASAPDALNFPQTTLLTPYCHVSLFSGAIRLCHSRQQPAYHTTYPPLARELCHCARPSHTPTKARILSTILITPKLRQRKRRDTHRKIRALRARTHALCQDAFLQRLRAAYEQIYALIVDVTDNIVDHTDTPTLRNHGDTVYSSFIDAYRPLRRHLYTAPLLP
jgi:hypothetical protein